MTNTAQGGPTPKKDQTDESFTLDSGGGPKEGFFAGYGPLNENDPPPPKAVKE